VFWNTATIPYSSTEEEGEKEMGFTPKWTRTRVLSSSTAVLAALGLVACGSSSTSSGSDPSGSPAGTVQTTHTVQLGNGESVTEKKGTPVKIGFFIATESNLYTKAMAAQAQQVSQQTHVPVTVFDGNFDATTQYDQLQNALQSKKYNAWYVTPIDGQQQCNMLSKQAPAAGIVVGTSDLALCNRGTDPASDIWQPGTLDYSAAEDTSTFDTAWVNYVASQLHGAHNIAVLYGPSLITLNSNVANALKALQKRRPDLHIVASVDTDFSTAAGLADTQNLLRSHPNIDTILSVYADVTVGAVRAVQEAHAHAKIFDLGASSEELGDIRDGAITASAVYDPRTTVSTVLHALIDAVRNGTPVPHYASGLAYGTTQDPYEVTKANVNSYHPEY
jgi:ribose transport system substrate-binding protein